MAEIGAHVKDLRSRGATKVVEVGHSIRVTAALSFAVRDGEVQALVLLAPGHIPRTYYSPQNYNVVRESVDEAQALVAAGKGRALRPRPAAVDKRSGNWG